MRLIQKLLISVFFILQDSFTKAQHPVHVWEMQELSFTAASNYKNPYTEVKMWVELSGPDFNKKVFGFWDGGNTYKVRVVAMKPGTWKWKSGSGTNDPGLTNKSGQVVLKRSRSHSNCRARIWECCYSMQTATNSMICM